MRRAGCWLLMFVWITGPAWAQDAPAGGAGSKFALTIYSSANPGSTGPQMAGRAPDDGIPGFAVVQEVRRMSLEAGVNTVRFADVAAGIDPTTVSFRSLTAPETTSVLEQSFEHDVTSPDKLLEKYIGRSIIINRKVEPLAGDRTRMPETIEAKLLAFTADHLVLQTNNKQLPVQIIPRNDDLWEIKLFDLEAGLATRPTLVWKIKAEQRGEHEVLVTYQTDHITWRADYSLVVDRNEKLAELGAWVSIMNESGAAYREAKLKLVAKDVRGLRKGPVPEHRAYALGRPTTIANHSTLQIALFPRRRGLGVEKEYVYDALGDLRIAAGGPLIKRDLELPAHENVDLYVKLANTQKNGLGMPLPAGRVRVYQRDEGEDVGALEFVGEDRIDHVANDQQARIRIGRATDVTGERKVRDFAIDVDARTMSESIAVTLRNRKDQAVKVIVRERPVRWSGWEVAQSSEKFAKTSAQAFEIPVEVAAGGEKVVRVTVRYDW